jgi:hypothetical protein
MNPNLAISIASKVFELITEWATVAGSKTKDDALATYRHAENYGIDPWRFALVRIHNALKELPNVREVKPDPAALHLIEKQLVELANAGAVALNAFRQFREALPKPAEEPAETTVAETATT